MSGTVPGSEKGGHRYASRNPSWYRFNDRLLLHATALLLSDRRREAFELSGAVTSGVSFLALFGAMRRARGKERRGTPGAGKEALAALMAAG